MRLFIAEKPSVGNLFQRVGDAGPKRARWVPGARLQADLSRPQGQARRQLRPYLNPNP